MRAKAFQVSASLSHFESKKSIILQLLFQASSSFHEALRDLQQVFDLRKSSIEDSVLQKRLEVFRSCQGAIDPKICQAEAYEKALRSQDAKLVKEIEDSLGNFFSQESGRFLKINYWF